MCTIVESFITRSPRAARIPSMRVQVCQSRAQIRKYQLRVIRSGLDVVKNKDHARVLRSNIFTFRSVWTCALTSF